MDLAITDNPSRIKDQAFSGGGVPVSAKPVCTVFGVCGGCRYQDLSYADELTVKQRQVRTLFIEGLGLPEAVLEPITP